MMQLSHCIVINYFMGQGPHVHVSRRRMCKDYKRGQELRAVLKLIFNLLGAQVPLIRRLFQGGQSSYNLACPSPPQICHQLTNVLRYNSLVFTKHFYKIPSVPGVL